ncbi:MAG: hypothetical protein ACE5GZ_03670 [Gammaproteobacteria bacterium]
MAQGKNRKYLIKRARKGRKGYPIATVAFYGPDNKRASKVVCGIIMNEGEEPKNMKKWTSDDDIRKSEKVLEEVISFIEENSARTVGMIDQIIGCPHEEGIDYPDGKTCPVCPYWKNRDRFSHEIIQ